MNRSVLYSVIIVVLMSITANRATGQPEMWFPNPAYMIWEQPCLDRYGIWISGSLDHHPTFPGISLLLGDRCEHSCYVNPFNAEKQTIYGVAFSLCNHDDYVLGRPSPIDRRVSFDILIYNFTSGDSNVQLVKRQSFVVEPNQSPDLTMLYNSLFHVRNPELEDPDSIIRIPMYEFYFDSPVDLYGDFYVGIHSLDTFEVVGAVIGNGGQILNQDMQDSSVCCPSGYLGYVDIERNVLLFWDAECNWRFGQTWGEDNWSGDSYHGVNAPQTDTIFTMRTQAFMPILRPQGYLSATAPMAEMGNVRLQPNPARTHVVVEAECAIKHVELADMSGRVLLSERYDGQAQSVTLDVSSLAKGSYVVKVKTERDESAQKLLVE